LPVTGSDALTVATVRSQRAVNVDNRLTGTPKASWRSFCQMGTELRHGKNIAQEISQKAESQALARTVRRTHKERAQTGPADLRHSQARGNAPAFRLPTRSRSCLEIMGRAERSIDRSRG